METEELANLEATQDIMVPEEVSRYLRIPLPTVYRLSQKGRIPCRKIGRRWRYFREQIEAYARGEL